MGPEAKTQTTVVAWARGLRAIAFKQAGGYGGVPDYLFLFDGRCALIEFKSSLGRPTPLQRNFLAKLAEQNIPARICRTVDEAKTFLLEHLFKEI